MWDESLKYCGINYASNSPAESSNTRNKGTMNIKPVSDNCETRKKEK